jgi:hypothetical protein
MKDISDRHSFGVQWSPTYGLKCQLVNPKGTRTLHFHSNHAMSDTVDDPSRFGLMSPPRDYDEFLQIVRQYMNELDRMTEYAKKHTVIHKAEGGTRRVDEDTPRQRFLGLF